MTTDNNYNHENIEKKWQDYWDQNKTFKVTNEELKTAKSKKYVLDMFPYPSGSGLHMGHPLGYTGSDIYSRYLKHQGHTVLHPMGYDAFGLPAEQHAINTGEHPSKVTKLNCARFTKQLKMLGYSFDWDREIFTCEADYYKWTQWIFLKLYNSWFDEDKQKARPISELEIPNDVKEKGEKAIHDFQADHRLAYISEAPVNWCPALGTVLSNEEVIDGKSERGGHDVFIKPMRQWLLRITKYSERLLNDLSELDWPESIKEQQRNWIGRSEGVNFIQKIKDLDIEFEVYDSIPQTFLAQSFTVIAAEHELIPMLVKGTEYEKDVLDFVEHIKAKKQANKYDADKEMEGIFTGRYVENPFGTGDLPLWIASYVIADYGTGIVNCSSHDERDFEFAKKYNIPLRNALLPEDKEHAEKVKNFEVFYREPNGILQSPECVKGKKWYEAREEVIDYIVENNLGRRNVNYKLRDWLFSRQRYWGEPIPVIHFEDGTHVALKEDELPLELPEVEAYKPSEDGESPLARAGSWLDVTCESTGKKGRRETNTMPQWAGSCWYYLRFLDPNNTERLVDPEIEKNAMPVDLYVGGAEHAVLHLLYSRFWHKVLFDLNIVSTNEPFKRLFNQGMLVNFAYKDARGALVPVDEVVEKEGAYVREKTGEKVERITAKMSKSLKNVVNPDDVISEYGTDTLRMFLMFLGPLEGTKPWDSKAIAGVNRFIKKFWNLVGAQIENGLASDEEQDVKKSLAKCIKKVTESTENIRFNTAISALMECVNELSGKVLSKESVKNLLILISPYAPHLAEELNERLGEKESISKESWPAFDEALLVSDEINVVVQIKGKKRANVLVSKSISENDLKQSVVTAISKTQHNVSLDDRFIIVRDKKSGDVKLVNVIN